jgi:hypothetical protein
MAAVRDSKRRPCGKRYDPGRIQGDGKHRHLEKRRYGKLRSCWHSPSREPLDIRAVLRRNRSCRAPVANRKCAPRLRLQRNQTPHRAAKHLCSRMLASCSKACLESSAAFNECSCAIFANSKTELSLPLFNW